MDEVQVQVPRRGLRYGGQVLSLPDGRQPDTCPLPGAPSQRGCRTRSPMSPAPYHRVTEGPLGNSTCQWGRSTLYSGRPLAARRAQCQGAGCASPPISIHAPILGQPSASQSDAPPQSRAQGDPTPSLGLRLAEAASSQSHSFPAYLYLVE